MNVNDDFIKKTLQENLQQINDKSFTHKIVEAHVSKEQIVKNCLFINFTQLIIGLSAVILSLGLIFIIRQNYDWIKEIGLTDNHGLLILTLSFIFLIFKWIEEITAPKMRSYTPFA